MDASTELDKQPQPDDEISSPPENGVEAETAVATANEAPPEKKGRKRSRGRQPKKTGRQSRRGAFTVRQVADRFAACGRCSYFWAGYKVLCGEEAQETAVAESTTGWLELIWHPEIPRLLYKSYGVRLDVDFFHYEGCCQECRRRFMYQAAENDDEPGSCAIEVSPHRAE